MTGPKIRRRFSGTISFEGDTWEQAGSAVADALIELQRTSPKEINPNGKVLVLQHEVAGGEWKVELVRDAKMTPEAYAELKRKAAETEKALAESGCEDDHG